MSDTRLPGLIPNLFSQSIQGEGGGYGKQKE